MAFDWGYIIAGGVLLWIANSVYQKKYGKPISSLWKDREGGNVGKLSEITQYRKVYITKGIKQ